jgi:hypothetical protein
VTGSDVARAETQIPGGTHRHSAVNWLAQVRSRSFAAALLDLPHLYHHHRSPAMASPSPSSDVPPTKRRKMSDGNPHPVVHNFQHQPSPSAVAGGSNTSAALTSAPKRGARACTACRKGKNRCEGEVSKQAGAGLTTGRAERCPVGVARAVLVARPDAPLRRLPALRTLSTPNHDDADADDDLQAPCRRCQVTGAQCVFEKPERKTQTVINNNSIEYVHIYPSIPLRNPNQF